MPSTIPVVVVCAKIRIVTPINAATIQSALMGAFFSSADAVGSSLLPVGRSTTNVADDDVGRARVAVRNIRPIGPKRGSIIRSETIGGSTINGTVCDEAVGRPSVREAR